MSTPAQKASSRDKVRAHRARLRAQGLRPVQYWLPDVNSPEFKARLRQECLAIAASADEKDVMDLLESVRDEVWGEWNGE